MEKLTKINGNFLLDQASGKREEKSLFLEPLFTCRMLSNLHTDEKITITHEIRLSVSFSFLVFLISRMSLKFLAALIPLICFTHESSRKIPLVIGWVFDIDTKPGDENSASMIPIVRMAIKHVNACPKTLVNYELQMEVKDVKVGNTINLKDSCGSYTFSTRVDEEIMVIGCHANSRTCQVAALLQSKIL